MLPGRSGSSSSGYRYGFNGKEDDWELKGKGNSLDFGARMYDSRIGRWFARDPLFAKYPGLSVYNYVSNNPLNSIDPDGRLIIFINGMHTGDGGRSEYWNGLDKRVMDRVGDHNARYYDGAIGGAKNTFTRIFFAPTSFFTSLTTLNLFASARRKAGESMGYSQAQEIFEGLAENETIKIASHSMGGAYSKGFIKGLKKYAKKHNIDIKGKIEMEVDFAPFQPAKQSAESDVPTTTIAHKGDTVAGSEPMSGAKNNETRADKEPGVSEHSVDSFNQKEINTYVPKGKASGNAKGESKWEENPK